MIIKILLLINVLILGCQQTPTVVKQEVGGVAERSVIWVDTRSALEFNSFHISGSVSLNTDDFIILKDARSKIRKFDPDLEQTIERLAKKGLSPLKTVVLISNKKDSLENKKWQWLLNQLSIQDVKLMSLDEFRTLNRLLRPQPEPERMPIWQVNDLKKIIQNADYCFVNWSPQACH